MGDFVIDVFGLTPITSVDGSYNFYTYGALSYICKGLICEDELCMLM